MLVGLMLLLILFDMQYARQNDRVTFISLSVLQRYHYVLFSSFSVAPSLRAERLIWSLWRVSVHLYLTEGPPSQIIGSQKFQNQNVFQLILSNFSGGTPPPPPLVKGNIFDTRFGLIHVQTGKKKNFSKKIFFTPIS